MKYNYIPKSILVTGGLGFIGSNYIRNRLSNGHDGIIVNLDAQTYAASMHNISNFSDPHKHIFIKGDITNQKLVSDIFNTYEIDTVINFAAESHVDRSIIYPSVFMKTNIEGTYVLLDCARRYWQSVERMDLTKCRFLQISTDEIYGSCESLETPSFTEKSKYDPRSPYSASKAAANHIVKAYHNTFGLPTIITNCTNNFGPYQHDEKLIPKIIMSCMKQEEIPIYGNGSNVRDWLYVADHCAAIDMVLENAEIGEEYNISAGNELSNISIAHIICNLMDDYLDTPNACKKLIKFVEDRKGHDWRYSLSSAKIATTLRWKPKVAFAEGIKNTIEFYLTRRRVEVTDSLVENCL